MIIDILIVLAFVVTVRLIASWQRSEREWRKQREQERPICPRCQSSKRVNAGGPYAFLCTDCNLVFVSTAEEELVQP